MNALTIKTKPFLFLAAVAVLFLAGCKCDFEQPNSTFVAPANGGNHHHISAADYGTAIVQVGDTLTLGFPCAAEMPELPAGVGASLKGNEISLWTKAKPISNGKSASMAASTSFKHVILFNTANYKLTMQSGENFLPGDANRDGKRDMMDLYPIARAIWEHGSGIDWDLPNFDPTTIPIPFDTNQVYVRPVTDSTWQWTAAGSVIDYMHADCNFDGKIDLDDLELLKKVLEPAELPNMLTGAYSGISLSAIQTGPIEVFQPQGQSYPEILARYAISIQSSNPFDTILGVVFTRAVDEIPANNQGLIEYEVLDIDADVNGSDLFATETDMIKHQRYWKKIQIDLPDSCELAPNVVSRPLDVGIFNRNGPQILGSGAKLINCCVTIDDILRNVQNGVTPIYQHLINVVVFSTDGAGNIVATTTNCAFDQIYLDDSNSTVHETRPDHWWAGGKKKN